MALYETHEDEWFPVLSLSLDTPSYGDTAVELTDEELARVHAAFVEFGEIQHLLATREKRIEFRPSEPVIPEDPRDPYVKYAFAIEAFDRNPSRTRLLH